MNQLLDESQVNPLEYEEVAFQDLLEQNDNALFGNPDEESEVQLHQLYHSGEEDQEQKGLQQLEDEDVDQDASKQMPVIFHVV